MKNRIFAFVALGLANMVQANDGYVVASGGSVAPMKENLHIRMVREDIYVSLPSCTVQARFVFKNEGPATKVLIGFPEEAYNMEDLGEDESSRFKWFRSWVNGKRVHVARKTAKEEDEMVSKFWWVKEVSFKKGETKVIVNRYQTTPGGSHADKYYFDFTYILSTGAPWKGTIGQATITIHLGSAAKSFSKNETSEGYRRVGNRLVWKKRDFEPTGDDNITVSWQAPKKRKGK